jgi:hypothetical protein
MRARLRANPRLSRECVVLEKLKETTFWDYFAAILRNKPLTLELLQHRVAELQREVGPRSGVKDRLAIHLARRPSLAGEPESNAGHAPSRDHSPST